LVEAVIGLAASNVQVLRQAGQAVPAPVTVRALIDTAADVSCVDPQVLAPLVAAGLMPGRYVFANMPAMSGLNLAGEYTLSLTILHPSGNARAHLVLRNHPVVEQTLGPLGYQALVGRDILDRCLHVYDGPGKRFTLAY
jgi:hypothetical protein